MDLKFWFPKKLRLVLIIHIHGIDVNNTNRLSRQGMNKWKNFCGILSCIYHVRPRGNKENRLAY